MFREVLEIPILEFTLRVGDRIIHLFRCVRRILLRYCPVVTEMNRSGIPNLPWVVTELIQELLLKRTAWAVPAWAGIEGFKCVRQVFEARTPAFRGVRSAGLWKTEALTCRAQLPCLEH